jgi:hypothetical protein
MPRASSFVVGACLCAAMAAHAKDPTRKAPPPAGKPGQAARPATARKPVSTSDVGETRTISIHGVKLDGKAPATGESQERGNTTALPTSAASGPAPTVDDEVARERVSKQMRRYEKPIDDCVAAARRRNPQLLGELRLSIAVVERQVTLTATQDTSGDPGLLKCLVAASKTWQLPAANLVLPWTVSLEH